MKTYRVLIVDDQRDQRRKLRSMLGMVTANLQVADVPSAEEGLLEFYRQPVDLVIAELRLPGMTGLELIERLRLRKADVRSIILLAAEATLAPALDRPGGPDVVLRKPLDSEVLVPVVETCLGLRPALAAAASAETAAAAAPPAAKPAAEIALPPKPGAALTTEPTTPLTVADILAGLRQNLAAQAVVLLSDQGRAMAQAGDAPQIAPDSPLLPELMAAYSASLRVAAALERTPPLNSLCFGGEQVQLTLSTVGASAALLVVGPPTETPEALQRMFSTLRPAIAALLAALDDLGVVSPPPRKTGGLPQLAPAPPPDETGDLALADLLAEATDKKLLASDVDAFWDALVNAPQTGSLSAEVLSFEEARRLGLTPDEV